MEKYISLKELFKNMCKIEGSKLDRESAFWLGIIVVLNAYNNSMNQEIFEGWMHECENFGTNSALIRDLFEKK